MVTSKHRTRACASLAFVAALLMGAGAQAQTLRVTAANASNSSVYDVTFSGPGGFTTPLNTDANLHVSFRSLVFVPNTLTGKIDLLVADTLRGEIVRYADSGGASSVVWSVKRGPGPTYPDGLSIDGNGNLFVVSSASSKARRGELWVLPRDPAAPAGAGFLAPRLVDSTFGGVAIHGLEETLPVRGSGGGANAGDLLVLASNPARVFVYAADALEGVINGSGPISPSRTLVDTALFPVKQEPGGMDFWPMDGSLLVTTSNGTVLRYGFENGAAVRRADFASGLGNGKFKVKTGIEAGIPYAFVANNNGGDILRFGTPPASGVNLPLSTVTSGVQHPQGLAASNLAAIEANTCLESEGGCDALGNVLSHAVKGPSSLPGYVIEDVCFVQVDPRIAQFGSCTGRSLPVAQVCAGFGDAVIPDHLCGGSGLSGGGFALVKSLTNSVDTAKGALIANEAFAETLLQTAAHPCPKTVLAWAPLEGEGTIVEGNSMIELTSGCGSSRALSRGLSVWGVGLVLNEGALPGKLPAVALHYFAAGKLDALSQTINLASIEPTFRVSLTNCIAASRISFDRLKYALAASQIVTCDALVAANESAFTQTAANPNPSGDVRSRIANIFLTLNSRLLTNPPLATWPPP